MDYKKDEHTQSREEAIKAAKDFFKNDEDAFNDCVEALDGWNGYLGDDRWFEMDEFDILMEGKTPLEIVDSIDRDFNANAAFFKFNGYGVAVSAWAKDYEAYLEEATIEALAKNVDELCGCDDEAIELLEAVRDAV